VATSGRVAVAILAAGRGARTGDTVAKPLLRLQGRPLVSWALDAAGASGLMPVLLVVGHEADTVAEVAPRDVEVVVSTEWRQGIAHSLRAALGALSGRPAVDGLCIGLADQPLVGVDAYRRVSAAYDDGADFAVATYDGVRGNPVMLRRSRWGEAMRLDGDEGARVLLRRHAVVEVPCDGTGDPSDVDTLDDLRAMEIRCASRTSSE
jgi:molybdenum cofactor cytidylyltransferase/nicotine blue oxidoreductase